MSKYTIKYICQTSRMTVTTWNKYISKVLTTIWSSLPATLSRHLPRRQQVSIIVSIKLLVLAPQSHLAKQHQTNVVLPRSKAVISRFSYHVCKVNSFSEHIASNWSFRRSNSQPLTHNTYIVSQPRSMPQ